VFSVGSTSRLYNEDPRPAEIELRESLQTVVEGSGEYRHIMVCEVYQ
jgi:hypothetical protein